MRLKQKLKTFFKTREGSDTAVELLRMYILPFLKGWDPNASIDDAIGAFFGIEDKKFFNGIAKRNFKMPGEYMVPAARPTRKFKDRTVLKGQKMLIVIDRKDQTARVDIIINHKYLTFKLSRPEVEFLKDYVEIKE